jgi:tRNA (guanine37-N1)-methyltransferase
MWKLTRNTCWKINVLTLFPEMFDALRHSVIGRAMGAGLVRLNIVDIRDFSMDKYRTVDDAPYGGGAGQLLRPDVLGRAIDSVYNREKPKGPIFYLSPRGRRFDQDAAEELSRGKETTFVCGHYEGIDERVIEYYAIKELSLGDFVTSGGEVALLPVIDAAARLIPGVLGSEGSLEDESFGKGLRGLLEYPQYTRPETWNGLKVPEILTSGHHKNITDWRRARSLELTAAMRPDLLRREQNEVRHMGRRERRDEKHSDSIPRHARSGKGNTGDI